MESAEVKAYFGDRNKVNWSTAVPVTIIHALAVWALFEFSWGALALAAALHWIAICWGIGMGYHRLLTHRGYVVPKPLEYFFAICGTLTLEGGPIFWTATHRIHHQFSDEDGDPHTPNDGAWWSHMLWVMFGTSMHSNTVALNKYAPDLARERFYLVLNKYHWVPLTVLGLVIWATLGWSYVLWAIFLRVTVGLHCTWAVNSATHLWGSRRFQTTDHSRNLWWVALLTFGEGWHNNHHAHPRSARHGLAWYELDISYMHIRLLELLGIAKNVQLPVAEQVDLMQMAIDERKAA